MTASASTKHGTVWRSRSQLGAVRHSTARYVRASHGIASQVDDRMHLGETGRFHQHMARPDLARRSRAGFGVT